MHLTRYLIFLSVLFLFSSSAHSEIFQYFDQDGTLIITDRPYSHRKGVANRYTQKNIKLAFIEDVFYEYYPVTGRNFHELIRSANTNGPLDTRDNRRYPAQTKWNLGWSYKFDYSYRIEEPYVYVSMNIFDINFKSDITVVLPLIPEDTELNYHDLKLWEDYVQHLISHEHDHVAIIKDPSYQNKTAAAISGLKELTLTYSPYSDIAAEIKNSIEAETEKIGHELMKRIKKRNDEYDEITEHGIKPEMRHIFLGK